MKNWIVTYKDKDFNGGAALVVAPTYTMAIVQFMIEYPECHYTGVLEVIGNESANA